MNSHTKFWAIFWLCIVALFTSSTGWVWPVCFAGAVAAVALSPGRRGDE